MKLPAHPIKTGQARLGLPGNVDMITGSAFLPAYLPTAGRQDGAYSRLARENETQKKTHGHPYHCDRPFGWSSVS